MDKALISVVIPVYSGETYLRKLVDELVKVKNIWEEKDYPFLLVEAIFVDDASIDNSAAELKMLSEIHPWIRVVTMSTNFGQHQATIAGILHSSGDWVATLDEDLQQHPKHLLEFIKKAVSESCDLIYAAPIENVHQSWFRDFSSRFYKNMMAHLAGISYIRHFNSFRLIRGSIARAAAAVCGHDMYLDVAFSWFTCRVGTIPLQLTDERYANEGISGYSLNRLMGHARRLIVSSQTKILRVGTLAGLLAITISVSYTIYVLSRKIFLTESINEPGWTSLMVAVLFFGGLISFMLGILLEYIRVILLQSQGKPTFYSVDRSQDGLINRKIRKIESINEQ